MIITMNKTNECLTSFSKSTITKDNLCDSYFDQLVIETSQKINQRLASSPQQSAPSSEVSSTQETEERNSSTSTSTVILHNRLNQPKRPMNAFMVWGQMIRRNLHQRFINVQNAMLSKALGRVWRSFNSEQKEPFVKRALQIKVIHKRNFPDYRYQPRKVQERRIKDSTLIGINFNHPVNQCPIRQTVFDMSNSDQRASFSQEFINYQAYAKQSTPASQSLANSNLQTIEYHPYALTHQQQLMADYHNSTYNPQTNEHGQQQLDNYNPYQQQQQAINNNFINHNQHTYIQHHHDYQQQCSSMYERWCGANNGNITFLAQQYNE